MKKPKNNNSWTPSPKTIKNAIVVLVVLAGVLLVLHKLTELGRNVQVLSYSTFLEKIDQDLIKKVYISGQDVEGIFTDGTRFETVIGNNANDWERLRRHNVEFSIVSPSNQLGMWYLFLFSCLFVVIWAIWYFIRSRSGAGNGGGAGNIFTMGKSGARMFLPSSIKENFNSVAGADEAKEELADVIDFLKNPKKYQRLGAKITRGVLLIGEPGNGKTLLARAVAGEANCPFFSISGSNFIEVFVGVGAARVRDLFAQARKHAPSIIFIDEIDAVGRHRGSGMGGGNDEREQTLNQLLAEMDGFETSPTPVIVIAATNRVDVLDKALLRPGRFDRRVNVPYPDLKSRESILAVHTKNIQAEESLDLKKIAQGTPGFSGADLANLVNEATIIASKENKDNVTIHDFDAARDKVMLGKESKTIMLTPDDKKLIAYHEAGHALVRLLLPETSDPLHKVTIIPRGAALGVTHYLPEREKYITSKEEMEASIMSALGGRVAEEIVFNKLTTGAYSDFQTANRITRNMVCHYGMSPEMGTIIYSQQHGDFEYSQKTAEKIDAEVQRLTQLYHDQTRTLLENNRDKLDALAHALIEKETMHADEIYTLLDIAPRQSHKLVS
ncbi:MAG TPA: ATP-dependent zinc metalloprotease FtsH [Candidatus Babeliales bacterium]|nr:ATP-dependent zinc metalloprotease FtsH [Candidatus Babeliales bacterium]